MSLTYRYMKDFPSKEQARGYRDRLKKEGRKAIVQKLSVGKKKYRYFVYGTKKKGKT